MELDMADFTVDEFHESAKQKYYYGIRINHGKNPDFFRSSLKILTFSGFQVFFTFFS